MSGFCGIYSLDGRPVEKADLETMTEILAHRGPDGSGLWHAGALGLGHRLLHTTPESLHEKLPLANRRGDLAITADARIDNREELLAALDFNDRPPGVITDSELILAAYEKWGESCPTKLLGDFAFAIWDSGNKRVFCARDHMGAKPFYYHHRPGRMFAFGSEIKALLCLPEVPRRLNERRVAQHLALWLEDNAGTFYGDILRLPPAHTLTVSRETARLQPYWSLDPYRELRLGSDEEYAEAFRGLFTEAVRCRLRSAFPLGSELSGGLDSSSVVCMARHLLSLNGNRPLHTFSLVSDSLPQCDERPFIHAVLAQGGLEPHYVVADHLSPLQDLQRMLWHLEEPIWGFNLALWEMNQLARKHNVRVMLDGNEGDVVVSLGYEGLVELARRGRWLTLGREIAGMAGCQGGTFPRNLYRWVVSPLVPGPLRRAWRKLHRPGLPHGSCGEIMRPDLARRTGMEEWKRTVPYNPPRGVRFSRFTHWLNLTWGDDAYIKETMNKIKATFSLEMRSPFYDRRLVEFCLALPPEQKMHHGYNRMVLRRALAPVLPEKVRWRGGKTSYAPSFTQRLRRFDRQILEDFVRQDAKAVSAYVDLCALEKAYRCFLSTGCQEAAHALWLAFTLAAWLFIQDFAPSRREV